MSGEHHHPVTIYYEDTDFTGVVYHANYLRYFERAREEMFGVRRLVELYDRDGVGFVVYRAELSYREGARHGDRLDIVSRATVETPYRVRFEHRAVRANAARPLVEGTVELVCVDRDGAVVKLPTALIEDFERAGT